MEHLLHKLVYIRPDDGSDTQVFYVESYIPAPRLNVIDQHGRAFTIPLADYPLADAAEQEKYWLARSTTAQNKDN